MATGVGVKTWNESTRKSGYAFTYLGSQSMAKLGPRVEGRKSVEIVPGVKVFQKQKGTELWIQIRQDANYEWDIVSTSFTRRGGDIRFKRISTR
jgi:hypothetical protein